MNHWIDSRWPYVLLMGYCFVCCLLLDGALAYSLASFPTLMLFNVVGLLVAVPLTVAVGYAVWLIATFD